MLSPFLLLLCIYVVSMLTTLGQLLVSLSKATLIGVIRTGCRYMPAYILVVIVMSPKLVTLKSLL